jgi:trk system potassium uptake protein TrkA
VHVVIMGCGRVGSRVACLLDSAGHSVAVVDQSERAFDRLGEGFGGQCITGVGFDRDVLTEAGTDRADAFAAVSSGDNSNVLAARVAREVFFVERVVARIYDDRRAAVYEKLGIPTVATVPWTADQILRRLDPPTLTQEWSDPTGSVVLAEVATHPTWIGESLAELELLAGLRVAFVTRLGSAMVPDARTVLQDGDIVHAVMPHDRRGTVQALLSEPYGEGR